MRTITINEFVNLPDHCMEKGGRRKMPAKQHARMCKDIAVGDTVFFFEDSPMKEEAVDNIPSIDFCVVQATVVEDTATYKLECYCDNCGAGEISVKIPLGERAERTLVTTMCPKCRCQGVHRSFPFSESLFGSEEE